MNIRRRSTCHVFVIIVSVHRTGPSRAEYREGHLFKDAGLYGKIILKLILKKWDGEAWIGLTWVMTGTDGGCV